MTFLSKKKIKVWIWTVICRETGKMIDFELGNRDTETFLRLWERIRDINCQVYYTDNWGSYKEVLPPEQHVISKRETCLVESRNSQIRTYGRRFFRKSKSYSKSRDMIYNGMMLVINKINQTADTNPKFQVQTI